MILRCLLPFLFLVFSGCDRETLHAGPRLDLRLSREFVTYEGNWQKGSPATPRAVGDGVCLNLGGIGDPRALIVIPALVVGAVTVIALVNGVADTVTVGRKEVHQDITLQIVCDGKAYQTPGFWGENRIVLTPELDAGIRQHGMVLRIQVAGKDPFDRVYQFPPIADPERAVIDFHPSGAIFIDGEAVYEPRPR